MTYDPEAWNGELETVDAFSTGRVEKDQVLARFKTEAIDEAIEGATKDLAIAKQRAGGPAGGRPPKPRRRQKPAIARAKLERDRAAKALKRFVDAERAIRTKDSELRIKGTEDSIKDQEEELAQLRKMYKADDVVEETEDIVMKRTVRALERTKIGLDMQLVRQRRFLETGLPNDLDDLEANAKRRGLRVRHRR